MTDQELYKIVDKWFSENIHRFDLVHYNGLDVFMDVFHVAREMRDTALITALTRVQSSVVHEEGSNESSPAAGSNPVVSIE